ncbi:MAG: hypothetical protein ABI334_08720 [Candidatus Dormiibacterota bacterium]
MAHPANPYVAATQALRSRSSDRLRAGITDFLVAEMPIADWRDVLVGLAPLHDCAMRIGADPRVVFDQAVIGLPEEVASLARTFGQRSDVTPRTFGFKVVEQADGPAYETGAVGNEPD